MMHTVSIELPDAVFAALRKAPEEFAQELRLAAAVKWYELGELSQGKAAEVAGLAAQFQARVNAAAAQRLTPEVARQLNAAITAVERPLVRLNYVQTDPYAHDLIR